MKQFRDTKYYATEDGKIYSSISKKFLKQSSNGKYLHVSLGKGNTTLVHRIIAECYCDNPNKYKEVNHIDGNKHNNHYLNLEWCTRSQNAKHAVDIGIMNTPKGEINGHAILTEEQVIEMRYLFDNNILTCRELCDIYTRPYLTIYYVVKRLSWKHLK